MSKSLRYAFFDLDNTVYPPSCGLMREIGDRINLFMVERLGIAPEEVGRTREDFLRAFGTTLNALRRYHAVDPDEFLAFVHDIPVDRYLRYDAPLDRMLQRLKLRKAVFTNADARHARRVLARLGVLRHFEWIIDIHMLDFINKPDRRAYLKALDLVGALPEECVLVEDSLKNAAAARELGLTTVLVGDNARTDGAHHRIERVTDLERVL